jgi:hypothetical protein
MEMTLSGRNLKSGLKKISGTKKDEALPSDKLAKAANSSNPLTKRKATLATTLKRMKNK